MMTKAALLNKYLEENFCCNKSNPLGLGGNAGAARTSAVVLVQLCRWRQMRSCWELAQESKHCPFHR